MSRAAQAPFPCFRDRFRFAPACSALLAACFFLSACAAGTSGTRRGEVDATIHTGDIAAPAGGETDAELLSDQATVRNAVSSADIELLSGAAVRWANSRTGARGSITGLTESKRDGTFCRGFVTTHETYDGVRLFRGEVCMVGSGVWSMQAFEAL